MCLHVDGALSVDSAAGAGKSSTIVSRVSYLNSQKGIPFENMLLITFSKKASEEMIEKAIKLGMADKKDISKITSGTFHAIFLKILRDNGLTREIWSSDKSRQITIKTILRYLNIDKAYDAETVLAKISSYKNKLIGIEDAPDHTYPQKEFISIWKKYEEYKENKSLIDFDDMLFLAYGLFLRKPEALEEVRKKFQYIMVDEFQDNSLAMGELIRMIAHPRNNVVAVGDLFQTIFSFSGATIKNMLNFGVIYPNAKKINMTVNYRSTNTILGLANNVIGCHETNPEKTSLSIFPSEIYPRFIKPNDSEDEANYIVNEIKSLVDSGECSNKDFAILYRTNANSRAIFEELLMNKISFIQYGGEEIFYESATNKPVLDYLRLAIDPTNMYAVEGVLNSFYIARDKISYIKSRQKANPISNPIEHILDELKPYPKSKAIEKIQLIKRIGKHRPQTAIAFVRETYEQFLLGDDIETNSTLHKEIIRETLNELEQSSKKYSTIEEYLTFVDMIVRNSKIQKEMQKKPNNNSVKMMSIHRAKGLEFPHIYLLSAIEKVLPHAASLEDCTDVFNENDESPIIEEKRLMYVALTRAKTNLTISIPQTHKGKPSKVSRFIEKYVNDEDPFEEELVEVVQYG